MVQLPEVIFELPQIKKSTLDVFEIAVQCSFPDIELLLAGG